MEKIEEAAPGAGYTICGDNNCLATGELVLASGDLISGRRMIEWKPTTEAARFKFLGVPQPINGTLHSNGQLQVSGGKLYLIQSGDKCLEASGPDTNLALVDCVQVTPNDVASLKQLFMVVDASGKIREDLDLTQTNVTSNGPINGNGTYQNGNGTTGNGTDTVPPYSSAIKFGLSVGVLIALFL